MAQIDFCLTENNLVCGVESFFSLLPLILFLILGYCSFKETKAITAYSREPWTWRHIIKLAFSALLAILSFVFLLVYLLTETDISLKTVLAWGATCFLWVFNSVLMRCEFEKLGFTTGYLRMAWISVFICQTILLIMGLAGLNEDSFERVLVVYCLDEAFLFIMILLGFVISDDYPSRKQNDIYSSVASEIGLEVDEDAYKALMGSVQRHDSEERKESDNFKPFSSGENRNRPTEGQLNRSGQILTSSTQLHSAKEYPAEGFSKGNNTTLRASNTSVQFDLREEVQNIESIGVIRHEDTMRFDKATIVYIIEYYIKGHRFITKRSYSEFLYLYKEIKNDKICSNLPEMPSKKPLLGKSEEVIEERKEAFDVLMKFLISEKLAFDYLKSFLQTPNNLPYYGKISKKDSAKLIPPNNSVLSAFEGPKYQPPALESSQTLRADHGINSSPVLKKEREERTERKPTQSRLYLLETVKVFRGAEDSIYYTIRINEKVSGEEVNIVKRYREFKEMHEQLKKTLNKRIRQRLPELPNKGPVGPFGSADDPRVVAYRKIELPIYLSKLLNTPEFAGNLHINNFIQSGMQ